jgi:hypothetical protein
LHEAAHLERRDDYALPMERILEAIFSLHPVVRWIARRIDLEREIACDDLVAEATGQPHRYADCLTRVVALCGPVRGSLAAAHAAGNRSHFSQRVELLIDRSRDTRTRLFGARLAGFAAALVALTLILASTPGLLAFAAPQKEIPMTKRTKLAVAAVAAVAAAQPVRPQPQAQAPTQIPLQFQKRVEPAAAGQQMVLYFDTTLFTSGDVERAIAVAEKLVKQLKPDGKAAVIVGAAGKVQVKQDFTNDQDLLLRAIRQLDDVPASGISGAPTSRDFAASLTTLFDMLRLVSGKKALMYITVPGGGFASAAELRDAVDAATRATVAVFPIDVRGLVAEPPH